MSDNQNTQSDQHKRQRGPAGGFGPRGMGEPVQKPKDFKKTFRRLLSYLRPFRANLVVVILFAILSTVFTIAAPKISGQAMDVMKDGIVSRMVIDQVATAQEKIKASVQEAMSSGDEGDGAAGDSAAVTPADAAKGAAPADAAAPASALASQAASLPTAQPASPDAKAMKEAMKPETVKALMNFMKYPPIKEAGTNGQKAKIAKSLFDLMKLMPKDAMTQGTNRSEVTFTDEQLDDALRAILQTGGTIDFGAIGNIMLLLIGMYALSALFTFIMQWVMSSVSQRTVYQLRKDVDRKLSTLPLKYFDTKTHGEILSRVTNDVDTISSTLQQSLTQLITSVVQIVGYICMMISISLWLTLFVLLTLPLYVLVTIVITKKSQKYFAAQQKHLGELSGHVEEMFSGHAIVKASSREEKSIEKFREVNKELLTAGTKAQFVSGIMFPLMNFVSNLGYVLISVVGGVWITKNMLTIGDITAFIQYSRSFTMPIVQTANIANVIQSTVACAERVFEVLDEQPEDRAGEADAELSVSEGKVDLKDVSFRYVEEEPLIEGLNLSVEPGHTVAIVGPTGAGKTTLVNLLMRFYDIKGGSIVIDGQDTSRIHRGELRKAFGMVLQDTWLFNGSIRDNVAYGREGATEEEIVAAAKAAHADHFIRTLPQGYDTVINEEATNISQGQKQLLTIARAILADPAILILDEATSNVDTRTEVLIQQAMANLMKGRTSFVIAHRLSTIRDAETILVMNKGSIIEKGNHKELMEKGGFYADLYQSQFAGPAA
jgi:ATP-binding cassette, subfamily B, multidrug efflux pump